MVLPVLAHKRRDSFPAWTMVNFDSNLRPHRRRAERGKLRSALNIYRVGFQQFDLGPASAIATVTIFLVMAFGYFYVRKSVSKRDRARTEHEIGNGTPRGRGKASMSKIRSIVVHEFIFNVPDVRYQGSLASGHISPGASLPMITRSRWKTRTDCVASMSRPWQSSSQATQPDDHLRADDWTRCAVTGIYI